MNFPLDIRFKTLAIAGQVSVTDAHGALLYYVRQKAFKLKEAVTVYADAAQTQPLYQVGADRILDISARYRITDQGGMEVGALQRQGLRSFWRAHYAIERPGQPELTIQEESPWVKVADGVIESIPIVSLLSGYIFHPAYIVTAAASPSPLVRVVKQPALFEGRFQVQSLTTDHISDIVVIALVMMLLLERSRG